jgi:hypothetical protein
VKEALPYLSLAFVIASLFLSLWIANRAGSWRNSDELKVIDTRLNTVEQRVSVAESRIDNEVDRLEGLVKRIEFAVQRLEGAAMKVG